MFYLLLMGSCESDIPRPDIPFVFVREEVNINSIQHKELWNAGGFTTIPGGYKGIIIYNEGGNTYRAFERACTFDPKADCSLIEIDDSRLFMVDSCCSSTFDFSGIPTGGPASIPLLEYETYQDGNFLVISNE